MKPVRRLLPFLAALIDAVAVLVAAYLTCVLRVALNPFFSRAFTISTAIDLFPSPVVVVAMWLWALSTAGAYELRPRTGLHISGFTLARCSLIATVGTVVLMFLLRARQEELSRSLVLLSAPLTIALLATGRSLVALLVKRLAGSGYGVEQVAIIGEDRYAREFGQRVQALAGQGVHVAGIITPEGDGDTEEVLGPVSSLKEMINRHKLDRLVLADSTMPRPTVNQIALLCEQMGVRLDMVADFLGLASKRVSLWDIEGIPLISIERREFTRADEAVKRAVDIVSSLVLMVILLPPLVIIALLIKLDSVGPVLLRQDRVGKGGRHFAMLKFRSMHVDADAQRAALAGSNEKDGHIFKIHNDPRITRVGRWIRRFSVDELPQLFNVIKGEMSLVGPRPLPVADLEAGGSSFPLWIDQRQKMSPGLTGLWQVRGRSELPFRDMVKFDLYYLENWSLWLDAQILARTVWVVLRGEGAY